MEGRNEALSKAFSGVFYGALSVLYCQGIAWGILETPPNIPLQGIPTQYLGNVHF